MKKIKVLVRGIELTTVQKEIYADAVGDKFKYITCNISRRQGKTTLCTLLAQQWLINTNAVIGYMTPTFKLGKKIFNDILKVIPSDIIKSVDRSSLSLTTIIDSELKFFSGESPTAIRGFGFNYFIVDEAQYIPEVKDGQNVWQEIIRPTLRNASKVMLISTPCTTSGFFYEQYLRGLDPKKTVYRTIEADIYRDSLISKQEIEDLKSELHPRFFAREFLCQFNSTDGALFDTNLIKKGKELKGMVFGGLDFSTTGTDATVLSVVDEYGAVEQFVYEGDLNKKYNSIANDIKKYKIPCTYAESNSMGLPMIEQIKKLLAGKFKIIPFTTTNTSKKDYIELLMDEVQQQRIASDDETLKNEMNVFEATVTQQKNIIYRARAGFHDDRVISLALAVRNKYDNKNKEFAFYQL